MPALIPVSKRRAAPPCRPLLILALAGATATNALTPDVWVVTDRQHPVSAPASARLIELDAPTRIQSELSEHLPANRDQATAIAARRLQDAALQQRLLAAYQGVADAWSVGVTKIPAVVMDRTWVVYGDPDVSRAISRIDQYRQTHR